MKKRKKLQIEKLRFRLCFSIRFVIKRFLVKLK